MGNNNKNERVRMKTDGDEQRQINKYILDSDRSTYQNTKNCQYGCLCNKSKKNRGLAEAVKGII